MVVFKFHVEYWYQSSCNSCYMENNHEDGAIDLGATPTMMEIMPVDDGGSCPCFGDEDQRRKDKGAISYHI